MLACIASSRSELHLSSFNYRAALPARAASRSRRPWRAEEDSGFLACNSIWLLGDFTPSNGATRLVPGSTAGDRPPTRRCRTPPPPHPDEVLLVAPAGSVCVFNAHIWHGGTQNRTTRPRRAMHAFFGRRDVPQQLDQRAYARPETRARLSPAARHVLDV